MRFGTHGYRWAGLAVIAICGLAGTALAQSDAAPGIAISAEKQRVVDHWTPARRAAAQPRDLVLDASGQAFLRRPDGSLEPYGAPARGQLRATQVPTAKPPSAGGGDSDDTTAPSISAMVPAEGGVIGASQEFSAVITDASGIRSVSFVVTYPDGVTEQSFSPGYAGNDTWSVTLQGFSDGDWSWHVIAKDTAKKGGNTATSPSVGFSVDTGGGGGGTGGGGYVTTNAAWSAGGAVQTAAGRIYFEMPNNVRRKRWSGYVCSGTVATDGVTGRSIVITAAHCVFDDANKAFARKVLFIPNQAGTSGGGTDLNCNNDPLGCWVPSFGVVDHDWTIRQFPDNVAWDYAYYVVTDSGAHAGAGSSGALDTAAGSLAPNFATPYADDGDPSAASLDFTHALGYSYSEDPNFMYCAEDMTIASSVNWWLPSCGLSGGASGGPWVQPMDVPSGSGPIISVNSWGYTTAPGMAGPRLDVSSAACLFGEAKAVSFAAISSADGDAGLTVDYCP